MCLGHLAEDPAQLADFMAFSGYSPTGLRGALGSGPLHSGLVDYFVQNEALLLALCANNGLQPDDVMRVWAQHNRIK